MKEPGYYWLHKAKIRELLEINLLLVLRFPAQAVADLRPSFYLHSTLIFKHYRIWPQLCCSWWALTLHMGPGASTLMQCSSQSLILNLFSDFYLIYISLVNLIITVINSITDWLILRLHLFACYSIRIFSLMRPRLNSFHGRRGFHECMHLKELSCYNEPVPSYRDTHS